jgi:hypothetical protein
VGAWPLWKWLGLLNIILIGAGAVALAGGALWQELQIPRGRRQYPERSIPGILLLEVAAVGTLVYAIYRFDQAPRFTLTGFLLLAVGLMGGESDSEGPATLEPALRDMAVTARECDLI